MPDRTFYVCPCLTAHGIRDWHACKGYTAAGDMSLFGMAAVGAAAAGGESSNSDFLRALSQPLLIQTPLQASAHPPCYTFVIETEHRAVKLHSQPCMQISVALTSPCIADDAGNAFHTQSRPRCSCVERAGTGLTIFMLTSFHSAVSRACPAKLVCTATLADSITCICS